MDEERPAYPLYRVPTDKDATFLQGQKQQMERWSVSVSGGDTSRIETILTGSNLVLTGTTDKRLRSVAVDVPRGGAAPVSPANVALIDSDKFQVRFTDLGRFQLTDAALSALRDDVPEAARPILDGLKNKPFNSQKDLELQLWNGLMPLLAESAAQYERLKDELLERTPAEQREQLAAKVQAKLRDYTALRICRRRSWTRPGRRRVTISTSGSSMSRASRAIGTSSSRRRKTSARRLR